MPDLTETILPQLRANHLPGLALGGEPVYPDYNGGSILNLPPTICQLLGAPPLGETTLYPAYLKEIAGQTDNVIMILIDALGFLRFRDWLEKGIAPLWNNLLNQGVLAPLTSITPSTTSSALTTLWTGRSAATHGIMGYENWLKEYGIVANMILHTPITYQGDIGGLRRAGFDPNSFLNLPTLGQHLLAHGIETHAFLHRNIAHSGLSRMHLDGAQISPFSTPPELFINLRHLLTLNPHQRKFIWIYWGEVDHYSHFYGPDDERVAAEFAAFSNSLERDFLKPMGSRKRGDTLLMLTADHGMISTPQRPELDLRAHPELDDCLHILTGENRIMYLYIRPGYVEKVEAYFANQLGGKFDLLTPTQALESGIFGPGSYHPRLHQRIGDRIAIARGNNYLWWGNKENHLRGRHGGLTADEMLVPFYAAFI